MSATQIRKSTGIISILSILPHLFCCAIPAVAAMVALGGTVGLGAVLMTNPFYSFIDAYHIHFLAMAFAGVFLSAIFNLIAYRIDCREAACSHGSCAPKKRKAFRILIISCVLLVLDVSWFMAEKHVLGLHQHGQHHEDVHAGHDHDAHH